jgi:hypothetical protein
MNIMEHMEFNPDQFYETYPTVVILRPGYPARAQYKSTLLWDLWGDQIMDYVDQNCQDYADIGGCFGFGANSMAYQIFCSQGKYPKTKVFEIVPEFINIGKQLFPYIDFIQEDFSSYDGDPDVFDLITMFDIIEHIPNPDAFLSRVAKKTKLVLIKTPMETSGDWLGAKPPKKQGHEHPDGHVNFFSPFEYLEILKRNGFEVISGKFVKSIIPKGATRILDPEATRIFDPESGSEKVSYKKRGLYFLRHWAPFPITRRIFGGGDHICLAKTRLL